MVYVTEKWYTKYKSVLALSYKAIALYNKRKRDKALAIIQQIEEVAVLTPILRDLKIHILISFSQFDKAIEIINESGFHTDNENVVLQLSSLYDNIGDIENAIFVLKEFVNSHPNNIRVTTSLIRHYERTNLNEAYKYAKQISSYHPNNPQILADWMSIGFKTKHETEVAHLPSKITALQNSKKIKNKLNCWIQIDDFQTILKILNKQKEQMEKVYDLFTTCQMPIHMFLDQSGSSLSEFIYNNWESKNEKLLLWHYGGKPDTLFIKNIQIKQIIMDYTACLTAYSINLFPLIEKYFNNYILSLFCCK